MWVSRFGGKLGIGLGKVSQYIYIFIYLYIYICIERESVCVYINIVYAYIEYAMASFRLQVNEILTLQFTWKNGDRSTPLVVVGGQALHVLSPLVEST
jgi:hypothetical protein